MQFHTSVTKLCYLTYRTLVFHRHPIIHTVFFTFVERTQQRMALEIERKFLTQGSFMEFSTRKMHFKQGYLPTAKGCTVRIRMEDDRAFLTIKGPSNASGITRYEWNHEIDAHEAKELFLLCINNLIEKDRYLVPVGKHTYEVDVFHGENEGLIVAEIELDAEDEVFEKPSWLGQEVTGQRRYYNSHLAANPYTYW